MKNLFASLLLTAMMFTLVACDVNITMNQDDSEQDTDQAELDSPTWSTYTKVITPEANYSVQYPEDWIYREQGPHSDTSVLASVLFGTEDSVQGGYIWSLVNYGPTGDMDAQIEQIIASMGNQFADRQESRTTVIVDGQNATKVTVTTNEYPNWSYESVILVMDMNIFVMGNGAIPDPLFEDFYTSFDYTGLMQ